MNYYDIDLKSYENAEAIAHYDFFVTNCTFSSILILDSINKYGDDIIIYRASASSENCNKKVRYAKIQDSGYMVTVIDGFNKRHHISTNKMYRL